MRIATFDGGRIGILSADGSRIADVTDALREQVGVSSWPAACAAVHDRREEVERAAAGAASLPVADVAVGPAAPAPSKIVAAASNYGEHVDEMARTDVERRLLDFEVFLKAPSSIVGPGAEVRLPPGGPTHYEGELACVIGRTATAVAPERALDHVLGYVALIDFTLRAPGERSRRKSYDGFTPIGPWLTTVDEAGDWHDLTIDLTVDGEPRQRARAGEMLTPLPEIIAYASRVMTLQPGDVIATGSPAGVGPVEPGDRVVLAIDGLGRLDVRVA